jgi:hypothetical protein
VVQDIELFNNLLIISFLQATQYVLIKPENGTQIDGGMKTRKKYW